MQVPPVIDGTVLISDSDLEGIEFGDGVLNPYDGFRGIKPTAVIQHGVYVYSGRFPVPLAAALVEAHEAQKLAGEGRLKEALQRPATRCSLRLDRRGCRRRGVMFLQRPAKMRRRCHTTPLHFDRRRQCGRISRQDSQRV